MIKKRQFAEKQRRKALWRKKQNDLQNKKMGIVEDKDEGGFVVSYPDLPGCITCGETVESAITNAQDAKRAWLEAAIEDGIEISEPDNLEESAV